MTRISDIHDDDEVFRQELIAHGVPARDATPRPGDEARAARELARITAIPRRRRFQVPGFVPNRGRWVIGLPALAGAATVVTVLALVLPQLGGSRAAIPGGSSSASGVLPVLNDDDAIPLPKEDFRVVASPYEMITSFTPEEQLILDTAEYLVVKKCMEDKGFAYREPAPEARNPKRRALIFDVTVGILDADYAKSYGYQANPEDIGLGQGEVDMTDPYERALRSNGDGSSCLGEIAVDVGVDDNDVSRAVEQDAVQATLADGRYIEALAGWASCMRAQGFSYANPEQAYEAFDGFVSTDLTPEPSDEEIATAVADVECKRSSRVAAVFQRLLWENQVEGLGQRLSERIVIDGVKEQTLRDAREIVEELG